MAMGPPAVPPQYLGKPMEYQAAPSYLQETHAEKAFEV
jgi:hypothetical protein